MRALPVVPLGLALTFLACGPPAQAPVGSLRVAGDPPNATVTIDDQPIGTLDVVAAHGVALTAGRHRVSVEAPGRVPFDKIVEIPDKGRLVLDVRLERLPD